MSITPDQILYIVANNGLAIFLVVWYVWKGAKVVNKFSESFDRMTITLTTIQNYFEKFIRHKITGDE